MSEAVNAFMSSYLKKMRRPEFSQNFSPDEAFGANLVHGSESINPDAIRDRTNAQYGSMKSPITSSGTSVPGLGQVQGLPSPSQGVSQSSPTMNVASLVAPNAISPWLTEKLKDLMKGKPSDIVAGTMSLPAETPGETMMSALKAPTFGTESGLGGYSGVGQEFTKDIPMPSEILNPEVGGSIIEGFNPSSMGAGVATATAPMLTKMLTGSKTAGDVVGAGANVGMAAAQGGLNPLSDLAAVYSLYNLIKGIV
jgi:hypothetical protein